MPQISLNGKYDYVKQRKYRFIHGFLFCWRMSPIYSCLSCLFMLVDVFVPALNVLVTANFVDTALQSYSGGEELQGVIKYLLLFIALQVYSIFSSYFRGWVGIAFQQSIDRVLTPAVIAKYASLEYACMDDPDTYALVNRVIGQLHHFKGGFDLVCSAFRILVTLLSLMYVMFISVWWMIPVVILSVVPMCLATYKEGQENYEEEKAVNEIWRRVGYYDQVLRDKEGYEERGLFSFVKNISEKWAKLYKTGSDRHQKLYYKYEIKNDFRRIVSWILIAICVALMCVPLKNGQITVGLFVSLIGTTTTIISILTETLPSIVKNISGSKAYFRDYEEFCALKEEQEALHSPETKELPPVETIEFVDVSFRYPESSQWVLHHFSYTFTKENHYAIVGENGAGKSTFVKLLLGLYTPQSGEILLNGTRLSDYPYSVRKALFGAVFQDYNAYALSMRENIKIGNIKKENEDTICRTASIVGLESVARRLKNGYDTELGHIAENSVDLSGGEWQRLAIARLLYLDPSVLLLDEPSASLDPSAENEIYRMFHRISQNKMTILITHRLGVVHICDEILLIEEGKVSESGTHDFLMNQKGKYATMYNLQANQYRG